MTTDSGLSCLQFLTNAGIDDRSNQFWLGLPPVRLKEFRLLGMRCANSVCFVDDRHVTPGPLPTIVGGKQLLKQTHYFGRTCSLRNIKGGCAGRSQQPWIRTSVQQQAADQQLVAAACQQERRHSACISGI